MVSVHACNGVSERALISYLGQVLWSRSKKTWPSMYGRQYVESVYRLLLTSADSA